MKINPYPTVASDPFAEASQAPLKELRHLLARAQELLEGLFQENPPSAEPPRDRVLTADFGTPTLEDGCRRARFGKAYVYLGKQEMALLRILLSEDRYFSKAEILETMYPNASKPDINIVAVYLSFLRKKLRPLCGCRDPIQTLRGKGVRLHLDMLTQQPGDRPSITSEHQGHS